jgi:hypothetical protein
VRQTLARLHPQMWVTPRHPLNHTDKIWTQTRQRFVVQESRHAFDDILEIIALQILLQTILSRLTHFLNGKLTMNDRCQTYPVAAFETIEQIEWRLFRIGYSLRDHVP